MSKKLYSIEVKGNKHLWSFETWIDERYLPEWRKDGLMIHEIVNTVPERVNDAGLTRLWCWLQDKGVIRRG